MIITGGSRCNSRFFAAHLINQKDNERVSVIEMRGVASDDIRGALQEMDALASGTQCKNHFYHATINPRAEESLTGEQWERAVDVLEKELGLDGHSRFVVEHSKDGREHRHVIWSRIDTDSMTAVSDSNNYLKHEITSQKLSKEFEHEAVPPCLSRETQEKRPDRQHDNWEVFRGNKSGISPKEVKAEVTALFKESSDGLSFKQGLEQAGYILCKGDKRDFCIIDQAGDEHSLARRLDGVKAKDLREFMAGVDRESLPSVSQGRALAADSSSDRREVEAVGVEVALELEQGLTIEPPIDAPLLERKQESEEVQKVAIAEDQKQTEHEGLETLEAVNEPVSDRIKESQDLTPEKPLTAVQRETQPFIDQILRQGHIDMDLPDMGYEEIGLNWHERFALFMNRVTEHAKDWYDYGKEKAKSWSNYVLSRDSDINRDNDFEIER